MKRAYKIFEQEYERLMMSHKKKLTEALLKARDKNHAKQILEEDHHQNFRRSEQALINADLNNFFRTLKENYSMDSTLSEEEAFKKTFKELEVECTKEKVLLLASHKALVDFRSEFQLTRNEMTQEHIDGNRQRNKYWIGTESTEFVQLMYGLIEADRLQNKNIVQMIEDIANFLGLELSKNWQSNKSSSIHKRNHDYKPSIFIELEKGWERHVIKLAAKK